MKEKKTKWDTNVLPYMEYIEALARRGLTEKEIAGALRIAYSTFRKYKSEHSELEKALTENKDIADCRVENAMYKNAVGGFVTLKETKKTEDGTEEKTKEVYYPPDTKAGIFWLTNRQRDRWQDNKKIDAEIAVDNLEELI